MRRPIINKNFTRSALLSMYAAQIAHKKLMEQTPTEVNKGGPRLYDFS